ncbi:aminomethyl-transferring glycine dehydrogenase subunit GcvPA [bacterium]|nr:aminomethyl-transferring glycine dehydrogenase subunit GcvPA [candidate division CSSED10-310 bacterium]
MHYIPMTEEERRQMLKTVGATEISELFEDIPESYRLKQLLKLPEPMSEWDVLCHLKKLAEKNEPFDKTPCFLGGGSYRHCIPSVVPALIGRGEFVTAYTPYQPEISQGTLQALFEYQTMITQLTGMPIANASLYDGAMAVAEAVLMAQRVAKKPKFAISKALTPGYRTTIETYARHQNVILIDLPLNQDGSTDIAYLQSPDANDLAAVVIQSPNYFGVIEDIETIGLLKQNTGCLLITVINEMISLGILKPPGELRADIVCGDAQSLGLPVSYGGPYLGFFTVRESALRQMPGRVVGMTVDTEGRQGFVNTLSTREQHIRREKATSNICTNQALCAITAAAFMATLGKQGLRELALLNVKKAAYLKSKIASLDGFDIRFSGPTFNEFTVSVPGSVKKLNEYLLNNGVIGGIDASDQFPEYGNIMLVCATETNTREQLDQFVKLLAAYGRECF